VTILTSEHHQKMVVEDPPRKTHEAVHGKADGDTHTITCGGVGMGSWNVHESEHGFLGPRVTSALTTYALHIQLTTAHVKFLGHFGPLGLCSGRTLIEYVKCLLNNNFTHACPPQCHPYKTLKQAGGSKILDLYMNVHHLQRSALWQLQAQTPVRCNRLHIPKAN